MRFSDIARRLTGFSTPLVGLSWQPPESEEQVARRVIAYLDDRRVLYQPSELEVPAHCAMSVLDIRRFVTAEIGSLDRQSPLAANLRAIRAACRKFLAVVDETAIDEGGWQYARPGRWGYQSWVFATALGELRGVVGIHVALTLIASRHGVEDDLARILPTEGDEGVDVTHT